MDTIQVTDSRNEISIISNHNSRTETIKLFNSATIHILLNVFRPSLRSVNEFLLVTAWLGQRPDEHVIFVGRNGE